MLNSKSHPKLVKLSELTQKSIAEIAHEAGMQRQNLGQQLKSPCPTLKFSLRMQEVTGVNHQFFLYPYPLCLQFATKVK